MHKFIVEFFPCRKRYRKWARQTGEVRHHRKSRRSNTMGQHTINTVAKTGGVHLCIDMREVNYAIKWIKHPMPTIDDLIADLNGAAFFSNLDMKNTYHHLELEEASRYITTFTTHVRLRRCKRLLFWVNTIVEIFQNTISEFLKDITEATNLSNNIIVYGKNQTDHDINLKRILKRNDESGTKIKREKCLSSVNKLKFYGHVFGETREILMQESPTICYARQALTVTEQKKLANILVLYMELTVSISLCLEPILKSS